MFASEAKYNDDLSHPVMDSRLVGYSFVTKDVSLLQRVVFDARGLVPDNPHNDVRPRGCQRRLSDKSHWPFDQIAALEPERVRGKAISEKSEK
ncbi:hypothetical protein EHI45_00765 [Rhizobium leguminosarum]|uniref:hypothetical protein n=1 Tax=Rhizobium leguminosarum TaxID=384 RepID=UPI000FEC8A68|nr:hypothetical protein [Rhizobium leguminosarum]RWX19207.1 hypothetical protein EHI45_00765 [Rhizobium leguminosarum]